MKDAGKFPSLPRPANSPDLNPLDYGVWGALEAMVEAERPTGELELRHAIRKAASILSKEIARKCVEQFPKRLDLCFDAKGGGTSNIKCKMRTTDESERPYRAP